MLGTSLEEVRIHFVSGNDVRLPTGSHMRERRCYCGTSYLLFYVGDTLIGLCKRGNVIQGIDSRRLFLSTLKISEISFSVRTLALPGM